MFEKITLNLNLNLKSKLQQFAPIGALVNNYIHRDLKFNNTAAETLFLLLCGSRIQADQRECQIAINYFLEML